MKPVAEMTEQEKADARKWIEAWKRATPELERMRRQDIRDADTARSIPAFDGLFEAAVRDFPPKPTSGLVEQQRLFRKNRT
jgi:hypothetical protein